MKSWETARLTFEKKKVREKILISEDNTRHKKPNSIIVIFIDMWKAESTQTDAQD